MTGASEGANVWGIYDVGSANGLIGADANGVRPIVNLKSDTKVVEGDGSKENPYVILGEESRGGDKYNKYLEARLSNLAEADINGNRYVTGLVENNYVHHVFNGGIAAGELSFAADEAFKDVEEIQGNNIVRGNLLEYTAGITLFNWEEEVNELHKFKDITIEDNYVMYSTTAGDPYKKKAGSIIGALVFSDNSVALPCANENLVIKDNVLYCSDGALIISGIPKEYYPVYTGNTYVQNPNEPFAYWFFRDGTFDVILAKKLSDLETFVREELGDETGVVLQ